MRRITDIAAEGILLGGGGRAILLQIANPAIGYAVANHSDFSNRPLDRLKNTVTYVYTVIFGSDTERELVVERVNRAHRPVRNETEEPIYTAFDPDLQLWVAATLYQTAITLYERLFGRLDEESAEVIYHDYGVLGTALQVPPGKWPPTRVAFYEYWQHALSELRVDKVTRGVASDLLYPHRAPRWLRLALPCARLLTAGLLPPKIRNEFQLPWNATRQKRFDLLLRILALVYPRLPRALRHLPKNYCLRQLRRPPAQP